jgi:hypothetical protein
VKHYYATTVAYRSTFEPAKLFDSVAEARAFDRGYMVSALGVATEADFARALREGDEKLHALVGLLLEEMA